MRTVIATALLAFIPSPVFAQHLGSRVQWQPGIADIDARLLQPVDIDIIGRAAVPALEMLSDATGVSLTVSPENLDTVGERKLTLISNGLSVKAIMIQLPEALRECHWDVDDAGDELIYLLHRHAGMGDFAEREREDRRRQMEITRQERRRAAIEDARRALAMSPEELEELERTDLFLARAAQHRLWRELMEHYVSLPEEYLAELVETGSVTRLYGELPPALHEAVCCSFELQRHCLLWEAEHSPFPQERAQEAQQLQQLADQIATAPDPDLKVCIRDITGREVSWGAVLQVDMVGTMMVPARYTRMSSAGNPYQWLLVETGDTPEEAQRAVARSRGEWFRLRDERQWSESDWVESSDPRLHQQISIPVYGTEEEGDRYVSLLELQQLIAAEIGLSIISDYFTGAGAGLYAGQQPLGEALWRDLYMLGNTGHFEWRLVGDTLVFHHTNWVRLAQRELPESLLEKYRERLTRQGLFTLDDAIEFAAETEGHAASYQRGGAAIPQDLLGAGLRQGWRYGVASPLLFYASLTPAEQSRARSREGLALAGLAAKGRQDLLHYVLVGGRNRDESIRRELARSVTFSLTESDGEAEGAAYTEYTFTFTFPEDADVSAHVVSTTIRLPEIAPTAQDDGDPGRSDDQGGEL